MAIVLVTGATGFVGSALTRRLVAEGSRVRIFRRPTSTLDLLGDVVRNVEHAVGQITDPLALDGAMTGVERVYHAAAYLGVEGREDRDALMRVNVDGTAAVVNAAVRHGVSRLLHVSSMAAFGRTERQETIIDERARWQHAKSNTAYAYSKYLAEVEVQRGIAEGLDAVVVNPALVFGVGREGENTRRLVDRIRHRRLPAIPSGGTNVVDVLDVVDGALRAMEKGATGRRYFLGSENLSWEEIIRTLVEAFDVDPPRFRLGRTPAMALAYLSEGLSVLTRAEPLITRESARLASRTYRYGNARAREELGWRPRPFRETAQRIAAVLSRLPAS